MQVRARNCNLIIPGGAGDQCGHRVVTIDADRDNVRRMRVPENRKADQRVRLRFLQVHGVVARDTVIDGNRAVGVLINRVSMRGLCRE